MKKTVSTSSGFWLVKQEPKAYSWDDFVREKKTEWTGVRNFQARNNLRAMKIGDTVLFYHSVFNSSVVGIAKVKKSAYPDPIATEGDWSCVLLAPEKALPRAVTLAEIKAEPALANIGLIKQSRLSVMPITKKEFECIVEMGTKPFH